MRDTLKPVCFKKLHAINWKINEKKKKAWSFFSLRKKKTKQHSHVSLFIYQVHSQVTGNQTEEILWPGRNPKVSKFTQSRKQTEFEGGARVFFFATWELVSGLHTWQMRPTYFHDQRALNTSTYGSKLFSKTRLPARTTRHEELRTKASFVIQRATFFFFQSIPLTL